MPAPSIYSLNIYPQRTQPPEDFAKNADTFFRNFGRIINDINSANEWVDDRYSTFNSEFNAANSRLALSESASEQIAVKVEAIELAINAGAVVGDATDFMLSTLKAIADSANNHVTLKFELIQNGVL